jgi:glycosyltransferase involved in cell wall biosynthesis
MRVLHLLDRPFPPDIRLEREVRSLSAAGYEVHVLARGAAGSAAPAGSPAVRAGAAIVHTLAVPRRWPLLGGRDLRYLLTFVDGAWLAGARALAREVRPALIHAHDLPLAMTALALGREAGTPVVLDFRENWPAALRVWRSAPERSIARRLRSRLVAAVHESGPRYRRAEIAAARRADAVLVVIEENRDRLARAGVPAGKLFVVRNAADPADLAGDRGGFAAPESPFLVVYAGDLAHFRGVQDVIGAMPAVRTRVPGALLLVLGDGPARPFLEAEARRLGAGDVVRFAGWVPPAAVGAALEAAAAGVIPHRRNPHTDTTMPNKIYQCLALGVPVVTSDARPLERLVAATGCGLSAGSGRPGTYASALLALADPAERALRAGNAKAAAVSWEGEARLLLEVYGRLVRRV